MTMESDNAESLGEIADTPDNLLTAMNMPIPAEQEPAEWRVFVERGRVRFAVEHQSFTLDYDPQSDGNFSVNEQLEWMAAQLRIALSRLAAPPAPSVPEGKYGWMATHLKTGNQYQVIGEAINTQDGKVMVIYERDGTTFVREANEFMDKFAAAPKYEGEPK